jgi:uncharacterized delta-60 repeat protein
MRLRLKNVCCARCLTPGKRVGSGESGLRVKCRRWTLWFALAVLCFMASPPAAVAMVPGSLDPSFTLAGRFVDGFAVSAIQRQRDGRILLGGNFKALAGAPRNGIVRLLPNLRLDNSFNPGTGFDFSGIGLMQINDIAVQADGKILVAGVFDSYNGLPCINLIRLNANGSVDPEFLRSAGVNGAIRSVAVQRDGNILIGGDFTQFGPISRVRVARLLTDGSLDFDFIPAAGPNAAVNKVALQRDGKILIGGSFTEYQAQARQRIARLHENGDLDTAFDTASGASGEVTDVLPQADGRILIAGGFFEYKMMIRSGLARLQANGDLDTGYADHSGFNNSVRRLYPQPGGRLLAVGSFTEVAGQPCRATALLDGRGRRVGSYGGATASFPTSVSRALSLGGRGFLVAGNFPDSNLYPLAVINSRGVVQPQALTRGGPNWTVADAAPAAGGKWMIGGGFTIFNGVPVPGLVRLNAGGTLDGSFRVRDPDLRSVTHVLTQPDGKILVAGYFVNPLNPADPQVVRVSRLLADGGVDASFTPTQPINGDIRAMCLQADGKLLLAGDFNSINGTPRIRLARLNANGVHDLGFDPGDGPNAAVETIAVDSLGRILIGGDFSLYDTIGSIRVCRLLPSGSIDFDFDPGSGANGRVNALLVTPSGRIVVGGQFTQFGLTLRSRVAMLNANGTVNTDFDPGNGANDTVRGLALQGDGRILVGGNFTSFDLLSLPGIARLEADGQVDWRFNPGVGASGVSRIRTGADGTALLSGSFSSFDGVAASQYCKVLLSHRYQPGVYVGTTIGFGPAESAPNGQLRVVLRRGGDFTATVRMLGERLAFRGIFDPNGAATVSSRKRDGELVFLGLNAFRTAVDPMVIEGTIQNFNFTSYGEAFAGLVRGSATNAFTFFEGRYGMAAPDPDGPVVAVTPVSGAANFSMTITSRGRARVAGVLADGSRVTAAAQVSRFGTFGMHANLYRGRGYLNGVISVDETVLGFVIRPVGGSLTWLRPPDANYPDGVTTELSPTGSLYLERRSPLPAFGGTDPNSVRITISGGHLPVGVGAINSTLSFAPNGVAIVAGGSVDGLRLRVNRRLGTFAGRFVPPGQSRAVRLNGVLVNRNSGLGSATLRVGGSARSARVELAREIP